MHSIADTMTAAMLGNARLHAVSEEKSLYYLAWAVAVWVASIWAVDWSRFPKLLTYGLVGALTANVENEIGHRLNLWEYRDIGLLPDHHAVALVISLSAAPIFAMYFAQGLRLGQPLPWVRMARVTAVAMLPEVIGLVTGNLVYHRWWSIPASVLAYLPTWVGIWRLHRYLEPRLPTSS